MSLLIATQNMGFSPVDLFMDADLVVKSVIIGLALSSVWVWTIVISFTVKMSGINKKSDIFEREFWGSSDIAAFAKTHSQNDLPVAKVFAAGMAEWRLSTNGKSIDRSGTRERLATAMDATIAAETDRLANRLNFLATTGSVAPFVGLFGTVWGIMRSFAAIAAEQNSSLAVVAPGIAEALFATAIGLFAAIPAVVAYNRFARDVDRVANKLETFIEEFSNILQRNVGAGSAPTH